MMALYSWEISFFSPWISR